MLEEAPHASGPTLQGPEVGPGRRGELGLRARGGARRHAELEIPIQVLVGMAEQDLKVRAELAAEGSLFDGHHPGMQAVHDAHATRLAAIMDAGEAETLARLRRPPASSAQTASR